MRWRLRNLVATAAGYGTGPRRARPRQTTVPRRRPTRPPPRTRDAATAPRAACPQRPGAGRPDAAATPDRRRLLLDGRLRRQRCRPRPAGGCPRSTRRLGRRLVVAAAHGPGRSGARCSRTHPEMVALRLATRPRRRAPLDRPRRRRSDGCRPSPPRSRAPRSRSRSGCRGRRSRCPDGSCPSTRLIRSRSLWRSVMRRPFVADRRQDRARG